MNTSVTPHSFEAFLLGRNLLRQEQFDALGSEAERAGFTPEELEALLIAKHWLSEEEACHALADFYGYPYIHLAHTTFDPAALARFSRTLAITHAFVPFLVVGNEVSLAFTSLDLNLIDSLEKAAHCRVLPHFATRTQILDAIDIQYTASDIQRAAAGLDVSARLEDAVESKAIVDLAREVVVGAIKARASDIHVQPEEDHLLLRYRIDGVLHDEQKLPKDLHAPLAARFKILAKLDIAETRRPQDGRIQFAVASRSVDLRVSVIPGSNGEKVVLRILDKLGINLDVRTMYFAESVRNGLLNILAAPSGIILLTGPTGCGKTTTCYGMINYLNTKERNIVTIEDPIEYQFANITQMQTQSLIDFDFPDAIRAILRQDPDVILVGEIRDLESARSALEAALTGHLVISTLHTNSAVQAVVRLVEMGVEPFLVAPSLLGVLSQRLVRRVCRHCREPYRPDETELACFALEPGQRDVTLFRGAGCEHCRETGYFGRIGIHELFAVTDKARELISVRASVTELERAAEAAGYLTMRYDGLKKALLGLTTLDEVARMTTANDVTGP